MNKIFKIILITAIAVFGAGLLLANPVYANNNLTVEVWNESLGQFVSLDSKALFDEDNFLPGEAVVRDIKVINNTAETQQVGMNVMNKYICSVDCLSDKLTLTISENGSPLRSGSLTTFYEIGEFHLSDLGPGNNAVYELSMVFNSETGNDYKSLISGFDIRIGLFGEESIGEEIGSGGGGGGGGGGISIAGLRIEEEEIAEVQFDRVKITWQTTVKSTSRVIYSPVGFPHLLEPNEPPNYGYIFSTIEKDTPANTNGVIHHEVWLDGLLPGATYYYRVVSHASPPTISKEHSFTTLAIAPSPTPTSDPILPSPSPSSGPEVTPESSPESGSDLEQTPESGTDVIPDTILPDSILPAESDSEMGDIGLGANMMAAIGSIMDSKFLFGISLFLLFLLIVLLIKETRERYLKIKRKKIRMEKKKKEWHPFDQS